GCFSSEVSRLAARSSFRTESTWTSQTRWVRVVFCVPTASSRWYSWLRSSPSTATWAPLERVPAKSASFPKATHRCHSVRDSQDPASFFQDVLVASEKIAMSLGIAADKTDKRDSVEVHTFLLFCPFV